MAWWVPELVKFTMLIGCGILVQRLIRRHGLWYAEELFRGTPRAGAGFCALADIAYYLLLVSYSLFNVDLDRGPGPATLDDWQQAVYAVAGLALIVGALHAFNVFVLPSVARMLARQTPAPARRRHVPPAP